MIVFDLECSKGHMFEGWFNNHRSFEEQNAKRLVSCPYCNNTLVRRIMSPVAMKSASRGKEEVGDHPSLDYGRLAKEIVEYVNKNFEDVGPQFAKEALKMHYGVTEKRNIKGSATEQEEGVLRQEKIEFFRVPIPRIEEDDKN